MTVSDEPTRGPLGPVNDYEVQWPAGSWDVRTNIVETPVEGGWLRGWVLPLSTKNKRILMSAMRGPDFPSPAVKQVTRFIRWAVQAEDHEHYIGDGPDVRLKGKKFMRAYRAELSVLPVHFVLHHLEALLVIAFKAGTEELGDPAFALSAMIQDKVLKADVE